MLNTSTMNNMTLNNTDKTTHRCVHRGQLVRPIFNIYNMQRYIFLPTVLLVLSFQVGIQQTNNKRQ